MSSYLCEELVVEIFPRLPPKSLLRFRSLSKSLYNCISSPSFIRIHTFRSTQKILFKHRYKNKKTPFYTLHGEDRLPLSPNDGYIGITTIPCPSSSFNKIVGSCNGIFCLQSRNSLILWNPSIRRKLSLSEYPRRFEWLEAFGFGFDPISEDYKIIMISYARDTSLFYAVKTGAWCEIASPKPRCLDVSPYTCSLEGVLHWPVRYRIESEEMRLTCSILTFNLSTHVFGMIPLPTPASDWMTTGLTTIQGSLALISYHMKFDDTWIRVRRDSSWSVVFKLNTVKLFIQGAFQLQLRPNNNGDLLLIIAGQFSQEVHVYNPKTRELSKVVDFDAASRLIYFHQCIETLHLLDMGETLCKTT